MAFSGSTYLSLGCRLGGRDAGFFHCGGRRHDDSESLDFGLRGNFLVGENDEAGKGRLEESFEREAEFRAGEDEGLQALFDEKVRAFHQLAQQVLSSLRIDAEEHFEVRALDSGGEVLFESRVESDGFDNSRFGLVGWGEVDSEPAADLLGELVGVFINGSKVSDSLKDNG